MFGRGFQSLVAQASPEFLRADDGVGEMDPGPPGESRVTAAWPATRVVLRSVRSSGMSAL